MFPGYLDHFVTRNMSDELRISLSINFKRDEWHINTMTGSFVYNENDF